MAYSSNYYNYQIGVIFAILLGALILLAMVIAAIYYICVVNMRGDKTRARTPSAAPLPRRPEYGQPPYSSLQNQPMSAQPDYMTKTTTIVNNSTLPSGYQPQSSGYPPQSLIQPYSPDVAPDSRIRPLQPEYAYQQGPMTWTTMSPVHEGPYPMSPAPAVGGAYQLSTV